MSTSGKGASARKFWWIFKTQYCCLINLENGKKSSRCEINLKGEKTEIIRLQREAMTRIYIPIEGHKQLTARITFPSLDDSFFCFLEPTTGRLDLKVNTPRVSMNLSRSVFLRTRLKKRQKPKEITMVTCSAQGPSAYMPITGDPNRIPIWKWNPISFRNRWSFSKIKNARRLDCTPIHPVI